MVGPRPAIRLCAARPREAFAISGRGMLERVEIERTRNRRGRKRGPAAARARDIE
jgi:hypothetical protein